MSDRSLVEILSAAVRANMRRTGASIDEAARAQISAAITEFDMPVARLPASDALAEIVQSGEECG
jgi:hypothetical protein